MEEEAGFLQKIAKERRCLAAKNTKRIRGTFIGEREGSALLDAAVKEKLIGRKERK